MTLKIFELDCGKSNLYLEFSKRSFARYLINGQGLDFMPI